MCGSATLTMVASRMTISWAVAMTSRARPGWRLPTLVEVCPVAERVVVMPSMLANRGAFVAGQRNRLRPRQQGCGRGAAYYRGSRRGLLPRAGAQPGPGPYASEHGQ